MGVAAEADTDIDLVKRMAANDQQALERFLDRHGERIYRYLLRLTQDPALAEETANDVALEIWRCARSFRGEAKVTTWMLGIARNKAFNAMRGKQWLSYVPEQGEWLEDDNHEIEALRSDEERARLRKLLLESLRRLSAEHRDVLELTFFHECSYQEIAEIVGCPPATVRTRMHYARRALQKTLDDAPPSAAALIGRQ